MPKIKTDIQLNRIFMYRKLMHIAKYAILLYRKIEYILEWSKI